MIIEIDGYDMCMYYSWKVFANRSNSSLVYSSSVEVSFLPSGFIRWQHVSTRQESDCCRAYAGELLCGFHSFLSFSGNKSR